ncbi:MAG: pilus (MSHA type) biogenesis protein MshL [Gammaproteobacteria bacterium]|nr:pilus (MSHA type) biogenesis protein MshL [Gammaproteobacteria bacterium]
MWTLVPFPAERRAALAALCVLLLAGCQNPPPRKDNLDSARDTIAAAQAATVPVPEEVTRALVPKLELDAPKPLAPSDEQRFDISVNEVPARQFFMSLVDGTRYNLVVHPDVGGKISLSLKHVTIPEVIAAARDVYGYEFERTTYGFEIMPARLEARVYQINYLNMNRSGASSTFVSAGTLQRGGREDANQGVGQNGDTAPVTTDGNGAGRDGQRSAIGTQIITRQPETSFWQELTTSVSAIVGEGAGTSVVVNPQSGVIVVRALPSALREVEHFLTAAQLIAQRQVVLEAKILEVELSDGFQSGINWASVIGDFTLGQTGGGTVFPAAPIASDTQGLSTLLPRAAGLALPASGFGGVFSLALQGKDFGAFLELLKTQGNVQVLSSPRISTMNNQKAVIKVGTDEFFVTDVSTTTVTGTATTATPNIELTPFFSGIALDVTPQISQSGEVMLHIHPSVSEVQDQQKNITVGGVQQTLPLARSTVRESDSIVKALNGQLVVIGGLMQNQDVERDAKTPGLGELPVLGGLFRHRQTASRKSELVILLRPLVIETPDNWAAAFEAPRRELDALGRNLDDIAARQVGGNLGFPER